jgi:hypothetical protein
MNDLQLSKEENIRNLESLKFLVKDHEKALGLCEENEQILKGL